MHLCMQMLPLVLLEKAAATVLTSAPDSSIYVKQESFGEGEHI